MKKLILISLLLIFYLLIKFYPQANRSISSVPQKMKQDSHLKMKPPQNVKSDLANKNYLPNQNEKKDLKDLVIPHSLIDLGRNNILASNIYAASIKEKSLIPQEHIIYSDKSWVYFRDFHLKQMIPVAYVKSTNEFRPISKTLHIKNANNEIKEYLVSEGYEVISHFEKLNLIFVDTDIEKTLDIYTELKEKGLIVNIEITRLPLKLD
jgi:hypothetical protein